MKPSHILQIVIIIAVLVLAIVFLQFFNKKSGKNRPQTVEYDPIGLFYTNVEDWDKVPRQGRFAPHIKGTIEVFEEYVPALRTLKDMEYIIVTYHFHLIHDWDVETTPPAGTKSRGIFATRSPYRPNPLGITVCRLDSLKDNTLYLSGVDAYDHTPVLDIKPYLPSVDCIEDAKKEFEQSLGIPEIAWPDSLPE